MNKYIASLSKRSKVSIFMASFLLVCGFAHAATTVTVDDNNKVTVSPGIAQPVVYASAPAPVVVTREILPGDFEGRISQINYSQNWIAIQDSNGTNHQVSVKQDIINGYRIGDYVQVRPTTDVTIITLQENPRDFEGEIIRVDMSQSQIVVLDTNGRERRVQLKQGMIGTYKVDDYVRIHLMADLREAKTIETVSGMKSLDGNVVMLDSQGSRMIVRDSRGNERNVIVRQGMITTYRVGNQVRVYQLEDREDVQLIRVIR